MTKEEREIYQRGFQMAINYFYYALDDEGEKQKFKELVEKNVVSKKTDADTFMKTSLAIKNNLVNPEGEQCAEGFCWDEAKQACVPCRFDFAFKGDNFV